MNLLCPNCSKMLTVPEQYAGQLMKCPLCSGTFTVPALPPGGSSDAAAASAQPAFSPEPTSPDPYPMQPPASPSTPEPAFHVPATPEPAFQTAPPAPPPPVVPPTTFTGGPGLPPASKPLVPGDYTRGFALRANEQILQWVPPAALLLVFILQFFPWIGVYVGNVPVVTQGAWGAALGLEGDPDLDLKEFFEYTTPDKIEKDKELQSNRPGVSLLLLFYVFFFLIGLVVTVGVAALPFIKVPLPPQVQQLLPWKWGIVAGINAVLLLFLGLQMLLSFGLESSVAAWAASKPEVRAEPKESKDRQIARAKRSRDANLVQRTFWLKLAFVLHVLATLAAALVFWIEKRGPAQPPPALELKW